MTIGELVSALSTYCSEDDYLLFCRSIDSIEIRNDVINLYFTDANTADKTINKQGEFLHYNS